VKVVAPGFKPWKRDVTVAAGETVRPAPELEPIDLVTAQPPPPSPIVVEHPVAPLPPRDDSHPLWARWWLWTAVGAVAVGGTITYFATRAPSPPSTELGVFKPSL
jgi:hypothetical protein